ncbi:hypothetical protein ABEG17_06100 [Pedococcus sp. KACC 23699]|uniref:Uncharacterized protein n=1 Tax=Pedococcus sp. KACC 23699 TaxID=3149228 RepID=A0AAU7JWU7_9MICO
MSRPSDVTAALAMDAVAEAAGVLKAATFDKVFVQAPELVLRAVPVATSAQLSVTRHGDRQPAFSRADRVRLGERQVVPSPAPNSLSLSLRTHDRWATGALVLTSETSEDLTGAAALTAELMVILIEEAIERAHAADVITQLRRELAAARDVGIALAAASNGLDVATVLQMLGDLDPDAGQGFAPNDDQLISAEAAGSDVPLLRLLPGGGA